MNGKDMRHAIRSAALTVTLVITCVLPAAADYDAGKRAWDAGKPSAAFGQWQAAADAGDGRAMLGLGRLYLKGLGAPQDYVLAHMWFNLAASRGEMEALKERDAVTEKMTPQQVAEAQKRAREWRPGGAEAGEPKAVAASKPAAAGKAPSAGRPAAAPSRPAVGQPPPRAIREAQELLTALGYQPGAADGKWGERSAKAYAAFLRDAGQPPGDVLTPQGLHAMRTMAKSRGKGAEAGVAGSTKPQARPPRDEKVGNPKEFRDCPECPEMVMIPAGSFMMGSPEGEAGRDKNEGPRHEVRIGKAFAVGKYEVTRREYGEFVRETGRDMSGGCWVDDAAQGWKSDGGRSWEDPGFEQGARHPAVCVSWEDAKSYVKWLSGKTGKRYRLLSESEWEYVARGGTRGPFHFGGTIATDKANYNGNYTYGSGSKGVYRGKTVRVGSFSANDFGLHDVHGNVWEWVEDCWHADYKGAPADGSAWERESGGDCRRRVLRGGSWNSGPGSLRSAIRGWNTAGGRSSGIGFRIARTLTP